jgi:hypothetical protein
MLGGNQRLVARVAQPDRVRDCKSDELRIDDRRQFDDVDAVREGEERLRRLWRALTRFEVPERLFRASVGIPSPLIFEELLLFSSARNDPSPGLSGGYGTTRTRLGSAWWRSGPWPSR